MKKLLAITLLIGMVCAMSVAFAGESNWTVGYPDLFYGLHLQRNTRILNECPMDLK